MAVPQASAEAYVRMFPCPPADLLDIVTVVLVGAAASDEAARKLAASARALRVDGPKVVQWAHHLAAKYREWYPEITVDADALRVYGRLRGVPHELVDAAVTVETQGEADELLQVRIAVWGEASLGCMGCIRLHVPNWHVAPP